MPHWSCRSTLYYNFHSVDESGKKIKKYRLPSDPVTQAAYSKVFKTTERFQWDTGYICAAHWSTGERESPKYDLVANCQFHLLNSVEPSLNNTLGKE